MADRVTLTRDEARTAVLLLTKAAQVSSKPEVRKNFRAVAECLQGLLDGLTQITLSEEDTP